MPEQLERDLAELGRSVPTPRARTLEQSVMARIGEGGERPVLERYRLRLVAGGIAVLLALLAAPPVRAAVADWFGFGSVVVHRGNGETPGPVTSPTVGSGTSLAEAAGAVDFDVFELPALGEPDGAEVSADGRVLSLGWAAGPRVDQSSSLDYTFDKTATSVRFVSVLGEEALWFPDSHDVVLLDEDGTTIPDTRRIAGRTLIWTVGDTTLRLEGRLSLEQALEIAESSRPLQ
jgi:hypothetical protein